MFIKLGDLSGLKKTVKESLVFEEIVRECYYKASSAVYNSLDTPGVAVFSYGSPARREMVGGDADADILVIEDRRTEKSIEFKQKFSDNVARYRFSKLDTPDWGILEDVDIFLRTSLVEGNQVLESKFLVGDSKLARSVEQMKQEADTIERAITNIIFNRLYFDQYFRDKTNKGGVNIKYSSGGSRDFLFVYWHDRLDRKMDEDETESPLKPRFELGVNRLQEKGVITQEQAEAALAGASYLCELRSDILYLNKGTSMGGLTYLDNITIQRLSRIGYGTGTQIVESFEKAVSGVRDVAKVAWEQTITKAETQRAKGWADIFKKTINPATTETERAQIDINDPLLRIGTLWGANNAEQANLFNRIATQFADTNDWATIGSIVCSPLCQTELLSHFARNQGKRKGYGYILRVIARNRNVDRETLESIVHDKKLEKRYTEIASAALRGGRDEAQMQV